MFARSDFRLWASVLLYTGLYRADEPENLTKATVKQLCNVKFQNETRKTELGKILLNKTKFSVSKFKKL